MRATNYEHWSIETQIRDSICIIQEVTDNLGYTIVFLQNNLQV